MDRAQIEASAVSRAAAADPEQAEKIIIRAARRLAGMRRAERRRGSGTPGTVANGQFVMAREYCWDKVRRMRAAVEAIRLKS
jgi:hypothetical protein